jgi:hypothetical protein
VNAAEHEAALRDAFIEGCHTGGNLRPGEHIAPHFEKWRARNVRKAALDAGTAGMVRKQIETHVTLPAFVAESCQFDGLTEGGKDEWRRIFEAGLDAYFAAGGTR